MLRAKRFQHDVKSTWTYSKAAIFTQVDYILLGRLLSKRLIFAGIAESLDIGSDHRALRATFHVELNASSDVTKRKVSTVNFDGQRYLKSLELSCAVGGHWLWIVPLMPKSATSSKQCLPLPTNF